MTEETAEFGIVVRTPGGPENLEWVELPTTAPGPHEVRIAQHAIGVNFLDTYFRKGIYPWPSTPLIPGGEAAGVVEDVGAEVTGLKAGDRVAYTLPIGAYRTRRTLPAELEKVGTLRQEKKSAVSQSTVFQLPFQRIKIVTFKCRLHDIADLLIVARNLQLSQCTSNRHVVDEHLRLFHSSNGYTAQLPKFDIPEVLNTHPNPASDYGQDQAEGGAARPQQEQAQHRENP